MENEKNNKIKEIALMILVPLFCTIGGISLLVSGLEDGSIPVIIVGCFILVLVIIMVIAFLMDWFSKK